MTQLQAFLLPIFLHVLLVVYVGFRTITARVNSVQSRETRLKNIALDPSGWPPQIRKLGNNFDNQFDMPMMWYALSGLVVATARLDTALVVLAWAFLVARVIHALIHTGSNNIPRRMFAYLGGFAALLAMWVWFAVRLFWLG
ncbi:MAPEG family protein [Aestuariivirga litoralis]|uniref:MAPEG family protein n=1 Tax=Aestuariivirga litoralis TaxID=2650924 RepID=UPI0018C76DAD|nr:MAPEG family protein [Aestuariivirga litoralis]MBG1232165.1 MAPEG family protein [Aestuariivirga litoralis]